MLLKYVYYFSLETLQNRLNYRPPCVCFDRLLLVDMRLQFKKNYQTIDKQKLKIGLGIHMLGQLQNMNFVLLTLVHYWN